MPTMQSAPGAHIVLDGKPMLYFGGTAYTALQGDPRIINAACEATRQYGLASATSRSGIGNTPPTLDVERRAAEYFGCDDAFYFVSGYLGNAIFTRTLRGHVDIIFIDEASHFCVFEAAELLHQPLIRFKHRDVAELDRLLSEHVQPGMMPMVMTDGVFAVLGDIAPLAEYHRLLGRYDRAVLCVDDAHAAGVLGDNGRGTFEHAGLAGANTRLPLIDANPSGTYMLFSATLSKALGGFGGIIPGSNDFINAIKGHSRLYNGASAPTVPAAAATATALQLLMTEPAHQQNLRRNVAALKDKLRQLGLPVDDTPVPIIGLKLGDADNMRRIQRQLADNGIQIAYSPNYAGVGPEGMLRIAVFSTHTTEELDHLAEALRQAM